MQMNIGKMNVELVHTFPMRWMMYSMTIETATRTKQTTATAHVGVSSKDLPSLPPAIYIFRFSPSKKHLFIYICR